MDKLFNFIGHGYYIRKSNVNYLNKNRNEKTNIIDRSYYDGLM
jgi:hypothetical protein